MSSSANWSQIRPKLSLYEVLDKPGGVTVETAMRRAENAVDHHRSDAEKALKKAVAEIEQISRAAAEPDADDLYARSKFIIDIAGMFAPPLCRAAQSMCELVYRMKEAGSWDWPSVAVHVSTMRFVIDMRDDRDPGVSRMLGGLAAVVSKFPDPTPPDPPAPLQP